MRPADRTSRDCRTMGGDLLAALWQQPLWAVPFAVFFGLLSDVHTWNGVWVVYRASLIFAFAIRLAIVTARHTVLPRLIRRRPEPRDPRRLASWTEGLTYITASLVGSYLAAFIVDRTLLHGFLGSPRAIAVSGMFTLLFSALFTGIAYAIVFHRLALERARAVEQARAELAQAELRTLRAQLHPHFLFNTLNTIAALIVENPVAAEETVTRLAEVLRHALDASGREYVPLARELTFVRDILDIERTRFGERLRVVEHIDPALLDTPVPGLLLQPVVENAVQHGIGAKPGGGTVTITARAEGDALVLEVSDDGDGFAPGAGSRDGGFGLHAVRERLRLAGPPHQLDVDSAPGRGTRVRITLPRSSSSTPHDRGSA
jgi:two-component system, LytTR family, sensor histidine kinase AlgZ